MSRGAPSPYNSLKMKTNSRPMRVIASVLAFALVHGAFAPQLSLLDVLMNLGPCCIDEALKPGALILPQSA